MNHNGKKFKKSYLYIALGVAVAGTAGYLMLGNANGGEPKYRTDKVSKGDIVVQVRATGTVNPVQTVQVGTQVSGTVSKLFVDFNSTVRKNQVVAIIDSTFLYASVKEALANLERNQAQVNEAKRSFTRTSGLFAKSLVSQADLDAAQTAYESAAAQLKQAQAALDRAMVNLRYSVIRAPIDGVVISRDVDVGQTVAASLQAPRLFSIANDLKRMQVEASVDEADIGQIHEGLMATFTVDAYPDMSFRGKVTQVRLAPVTVQNVVTYTVIVEVPNEDMKLRPGMTATVSILVDQRREVLRVPTLALRFMPPAEAAPKVREQREAAPAAGRGDTLAPGAKGSWRGSWGGRRQQEGERHAPPAERTSRIWILENGTSLKSLSVKTGLNDNRFVELLGGELNEGDEIVVGMAGLETSSATGQQQNPFQPRMMGGGGGRRGM